MKGKRMINTNKNKSKKIVVFIIILILIIFVFVITRDSDNKKKTEETECTITLKNEDETTTITTDENGIMQEPEEPTREGYVFLGWYADGEQVDFSKPFTENIELEAIWGKIEEQETQGELVVEWIEVGGSAINQCKLYIKNSRGEYVEGILELTTIAGATFEEKVTINGSENIYIKSAIESVKIKEFK